MFYNSGKSVIFFQCVNIDYFWIVAVIRKYAEMSSSREHVLHLQKVSKQDSGMYQCEADNRVPPLGLGTVNLQVYCTYAISRVVIDVEKLIQRFKTGDLSAAFNI